MPLAFESLSHGTVAFGFFNIDSDMLLLDRYFFFATDFCQYMGEIAAQGTLESTEQYWEVYHIADPLKIGDLMGAIHGVRFTGFIGELYKIFPFPEKEWEFKQKPEGVETQPVVADTISKYATPSRIPFTMNQGQTEISIGPYRFHRRGFQALLRYVWQGGYPRWRDEKRPDYVLKMKKCIDMSRASLLEGLDLLF